MNPYIILAVVVAFVFNGFYWHAKGANGERIRLTAKLQAEQIEATNKARTQEQMWQEVVNGTVKNYDAKVKRIRGDLDAALAELRARPKRADDVPTTPGIKCSCGTGASLCAEDAEFLTREAARADEARAALGACYEVIDGVK